MIREAADGENLFTVRFICKYLFSPLPLPTVSWLLELTPVCSLSPPCSVPRLRGARGSHPGPQSAGAGE